MDVPIKSNTRQYILCGLFTSIIIIGGYIKVSLFIVPSTLQVLVVSLTSLILGKKAGFISLLVYIIMGLIGLPVFSEGGGLTYLLKPSFGYIIGFLLSVYVTGSIAHKDYNYSVKRFFAASLAGLVVIYVTGMLYYYFLSNFYLHNFKGFYHMLTYFCLVFIPSDVFYCFIASYIAKRIRPLI